MTQTPTVAIIGAGLIGRAWAALFARSGWEVRVFDPVPEVLAHAPERIATELHLLARHGLCDDPESARRSVHVVGSLAEAVSGACFVQENGPETEEAKRSIFSELDRLADADAILASSTSAVVPSRFTESLAHRQRCLVGHPVNPPHLVPLVEVCPAPWTNPTVVEQATAIYTSIGQVPVMVRKEVEGFVLNRLQGAVLAEAFRLVAEGVMSPQDVDHTIKDGLGLRWSFMGPFETIDLNSPGGLSEYCDRYMGFYRRIAAQAAGASAFDEASLERVKTTWLSPADARRIADRTAWRNERLAALRRHKQSQDPATD
ncbi:3-hydroxyacyl-CoA dehydrogenase [Alsobacter sp. R-9]